MRSHSPTSISARLSDDLAPNVAQWTSRLPFDIVHYMLDFASVADIVQLCSTCRPLHRYTKNGSIWKRACAQYGLHCDADFHHFNTAPPFTVYTQLLYPYGPLIGLWACDYPLIGGILEFRLLKGDKGEQGGIVGEVWSFPQSRSPPTRPISPTYARVIKISLEHEPPQPGDYPFLMKLIGRRTRLRAHVFCVADPTAPCAASLVRLHASHLRHHFRFYRHGIDTPFPNPNYMQWFDDPAARLPRVRAIPNPASMAPGARDLRAILGAYPAPREPVLCEFLDRRDGPPAIEFACSGIPVEDAMFDSDAPCPCIPLCSPPPLIRALCGLHAPRYFPLRAPATVPTAEGTSLVRDPAAAGWTPAALEGLWVGAVGAHTEVVHLACVRSAVGAQPPFCEITAIKLAGNTSVMRGDLSWRLLVPAAGGRVQVGQDLAAMRSAWQARRGPAPPRLFRGVGIFAYFRDVEYRARAKNIIAGIMNEDEILIIWNNATIEPRTYWRYKMSSTSTCRMNNPGV